MVYFGSAEGLLPYEDYEDDEDDNNDAADFVEARVDVEAVGIGQDTRRSRCPNPTNAMPPRIHPTAAVHPDLSPSAICTMIVPGHAPVHVIPKPCSTPPMILASYLANQPQD